MIEAGASRSQRAEARARSSEQFKFAEDASAARDLPFAQCRRRYIVCSLQRTGSSLLCRALTDTGLAGQPLEFLHPRMVKALLERFGRETTTVPEMMQFLERHRCTANGVFGVKVHFDQMERIDKNEGAAQRYLGRFDVAILVYRRDKLFQAISYERAIQSLYWEADKTDVLERARAWPVTYKPLAIAKHLVTFIQQEARWHSLLKQCGIPVLLVAYEDLVGDFPGRMQAIAGFIGDPDLAKVQFADPPHQKLSDAINEEWAARFLADIRGVKFPAG